MVTITVVNQKGGVSKTTICRNLGSLLAEKYGKKVLLVDLDSSGNLSNFFQLRKPSGDNRGASIVLSDLEVDPHDYIDKTRIENLYLLSGNDTLGKTEREIKTDMLLQQVRLSEQFKKIENEYDYCLIDCPPSVNNSILVINAMAYCDDIIIPCTPNMDSVDGVAHIAAMVYEIRKYYNDKLSIRGILFNRIGKKKKVDKDILMQNFGLPRFRVFIRESALAENSLAYNQTVFEYDPKRKNVITRDFENLAAELLGIDYPFPDDVPELSSDFI